MINIEISKDLKEKCSEIAIGCIEAKVKVKEKANIELWKAIEKRCNDIQETVKADEILKIKNIDISRRAYKAFGKDPSRYRLSSESLVKRIVKGNNLYQVNNIVDINNLLSLTSFNSVGTYDKNKISNDIIFTLGIKGEAYEGIGRGSINLENLPVFRDKNGNFGSTTSDSTRSMIDADTTDLIMNIISFGGDKELYEYMEYGKVLLEEYADGKIIDMKIIK
ncbi:MAG: B3/4 domain-containing protein [Clostridium sp.]